MQFQVYTLAVLAALAVRARIAYTINILFILPRILSFTSCVICLYLFHDSFFPYKVHLVTKNNTSYGIIGAPPKISTKLFNFYKMPLKEFPMYYMRFDNWPVYYAHIQQIFEYAGADELLKKRCLLSNLHDHTYHYLAMACRPDSLVDKSYQELCACIAKHCTVSHIQNVWLARQFFYQEKQDKDETALNWFSRSKSLALTCKFKAGFEEILMDRFISGMRPSACRDRLFDEDPEKLTVERVLIIAGQCDDAEEYQKEMKNKNKKKIK